jgi:nucleotide-binding universal stress UspA family protein
MTGSMAAATAPRFSGYRGLLWLFEQFKLIIALLRFSRSAGRDVDILVVNVQASLPPSRYVSAAMIKDHYTRMAKLSLASARSAARRLKLDAVFHSRRGDPAPTIARFAKKMNCGEIIMGTRGRGRMAAFVLGSVALRVIQLTSVPVTLVK